MSPQTLKWTELGKALQQSALDAHGPSHLPKVTAAYQFLLETPECFDDFDEWPADMPQEPNIELIVAYYDAYATYDACAVDDVK